MGEGNLISFSLPLIFGAKLEFEVLRNYRQVEIDPVQTAQGIKPV
jgi:hypothetical protein